MDVINDTELTAEINSMLKEKGLLNRIDGIRKRKGFDVEWAIDNGKEIYWFPLSQACHAVEKYVRAVMKVEI